MYLMYAYIVKFFAVFAAGFGGLLSVGALLYAAKVIIPNIHYGMVKVPRLDAGIALAFMDIAGIILITGIMLLPYANRIVRMAHYIKI